MKLYRRMFGALACTCLLASAEAQQPICCYYAGLVAKDGISIQGTNVYFDSYDSSDVTKSTNGQYDPAKKQPNGSIAAGGSVIDLGNSILSGMILADPSTTVTLGPAGSIGPTFTSPATDVSNAVANGWIRNDCPMYVPDVILPSGANAWVALGSIQHTTTLSSGNYRATDISLNGPVSQLTISGVVSLYITGNIMLTGNTMIVLTAGSSLTVYVAGNVFIGGNGVVNNSGYHWANNFYGLPTSTSWEIASYISSWSGLIVAPAATMTIYGPTDFSGGLIASNIAFMGSSFGIHYDEGRQIQPCTRTDFERGILRLTVGVTNIVRFWSAPARAYWPEYVDDLASTNWVGLPLVATTTRTCSGQVMFAFDPATAGVTQRFYRLHVYPWIVTH